MADDAKRYVIKNTLAWPLAIEFVARRVEQEKSVM